jgi:hypothetical protein
MFKEGRTNIKDDPRPVRPIYATSEKDISIVKAIVDDDARYTLVEISDISGLSATFVFFHLESKVNVKESVRPLDSAFAKTFENASALTRFKDRDPRRLREIVKGKRGFIVLVRQ